MITPDCLGLNLRLGRRGNWTASVRLVACRIFARGLHGQCCRAYCHPGLRPRHVLSRPVAHHNYFPLSGNSTRSGSWSDIRQQIPLQVNSVMTLGMKRRSRQAGRNDALSSEVPSAFKNQATWS